MSDIAELFARDPLELTKADIGEIVTYYRLARAAFNLGEKSAGSTKKMKAGPKEPTEVKDLKDLLGDLM